MSRPEDRAVRDPARILVRCPNWLGDIVMTTPGLRALRARFPTAEITAVLPRALAPLLEGLPHVDVVKGLDSREGGISGWREDVAWMRSRRFELGLVVPESISSALLMRLGGVSRVIGFSRDPLRRTLLHECVEAPPAWGRRRLVSKERFVLRLVGALGGNPEAMPDATRLDLVVTEAERARLARVLADAGDERGALREAHPIVIAPGASFGESKCWPEQCYAELADRLAADGQEVVLIGAPGETRKLASIRARMQSRPIVLDGTLDVGSLKSLLSGARALVSNDAGARHVAAAFGVPNVIFFGPTAVEKTAENLGRTQILEADHACRPCYRRTCPIDHRCLRSIPVDDAWRATQRALGGPVPESSAEPSTGMHVA